MSVRSSRTLLRALAVVVLLALPPAPAAAQVERLSQVHLAFASGEGRSPADSIAVTWRSVDAEPGRVRVDGPGALPGAFEAAARPIPGGHFLQVAVASGLRPGTRYAYAILGPDGAPAFTGSFTTAGGPAVLFTASADIGVTPASRALVERAAAARPSFHLACGDLSYANASRSPVQETIDRFMDLIEPLASSAAFMPIWGNHDYARPDRVENYLARFALPGNGKWYSFDAGPAHVVMLTSRMEPFAPGTPQREWLQQDLRAASRDPAIQWRIACLHHPPFSSGLVHGSDLPTREAWSPLFDAAGVDLVLSGHDHAYERTYPVTADGVVRGDRVAEFIEPGGPVYVVTGGGGESIYGLRRSEPAWSAIRVGAYHVSRVTIEPTPGGSRLTFEMVRPDGQVGDRFTVTKRR